MTTATTTLADFLLARLAEDEAVALAASPGGWSYGGVESVAGGTLYDESRRIADITYEQPDDHDGRIVRHLQKGEADANGAHIARHDPARVLREVAAKRSLVLQYLAVEETATSPSAEGVRVGLRATLRALASVYAGAPGWREEWAL